MASETSCSGYGFVKSFAAFATSVFFAKIEILGLENIPKDGPVIIVGNHKNQFVDAMMIMAYVERKVSFIIAEKSMHRPVIGPIAKVMGAVPVVRPQDLAIPGPGFIVKVDGEKCHMFGQDTRFTSSFQKGALVKVKGTEPFRVAEVISDTELRYSPSTNADEKSDPDVVNRNIEVVLQTRSGPGVKYSIVPKVDQSEIFSSVHKKLCDGGVIGIFPEGGSSDRTDLLPLKAGVTIMALGSAELGAPVKIVPYGINYFAGHLFRSRVLIDVGTPITPEADLIAQYHEGKKREACDTLLKTIEANLRGVTLNAPDYRVLRVMRTMRRMFQGSIRVPFRQYMELNRRFVGAYVEFKDKEPALEELFKEIEDYLHNCSANNLTDKDVEKLPPLGGCTVFFRAFFDFMWSIFVMVVLVPFTIPNIIMNSIPLYRVSSVVKKEVKKALAGSSVKVKGFDVAASQKIITATIWLVVTWFIEAIIVGILSYFLVPRTTPNAFLLNLFWILPLIFLVICIPYTYLTVRIYEIAFKRYALLPKYLLMMDSFFRGSTSPAVVLRTTRKTLALKVQDLFEYNIIPRTPNWAADPIIDRKLILDNRRVSDNEIGKKLNLSKLSESAPGALTAMSSDIQVDVAALRKGNLGVAPSLQQVPEEKSSVPVHVDP